MVSPRIEGRLGPSKRAESRKGPISQPRGRARVPSARTRQTGQVRSAICISHNFRHCEESPTKQSRLRQRPFAPGSNEIAASLADSLLAMTDRVIWRAVRNVAHVPDHGQGILRRLGSVPRSRKSRVNQKAPCCLRHFAFSIVRFSFFIARPQKEAFIWPRNGGRLPQNPAGIGVTE
jgi:hypothetical protein